MRVNHRIVSVDAVMITQCLLLNARICHQFRWKELSGDHFLRFRTRFIISTNGFRPRLFFVCTAACWVIRPLTLITFHSLKWPQHGNNSVFIAEISVFSFSFGRERKAPPKLSFYKVTNVVFFETVVRAESKIDSGLHESRFLRFKKRPNIQASCQSQAPLW